MSFLRGAWRPHTSALAASLVALAFLDLGACSLILDFSEPEHDAAPGDGAVDLCTVYEPNDSRDAPTDLVPGVHGPAAICPGGDRDFYRFALAEGADLDLLITFTNRAGAGDLELRLYDAAGVKIAESLSFDDDEQIIRSAALGNALGGGDYTFEVFGQGIGVENEYGISLTATGGTPVDAGVDAPALDGGHD